MEERVEGMEEAFVVIVQQSRLRAKDDELGPVGLETIRFGYSVQRQETDEQADKAHLLGITDGGELLDFPPTCIFMEKAAVEP